MTGESLVLSPLGSSAHDINGVCRLFKHVFGRPVPDAAWRWKYLAAPEGIAINLVAHEGVRGAPALGHVGCLVLPGSWKGGPALMAHLTDVMVHPSVRAGLSPYSVYGRLMRAMATELKALELARAVPLFAYGFPGRTPSRLGQRMGLYQPLLPIQQQNIWVHRLPAAGSSTPRTLFARPFRMAHQPTCPPTIQPSVRKDAAYLRWRYAEHPSRVYRLWSLAGGWGQTVGWVVTSHGQECWVVDASWSQQDPTVLSWSAVLSALGAATGRLLWRSWRPAGGGGIVDKSEPSLIVPGRFRVDEILESKRTPLSSIPLNREANLSNFHPGDTDVF